MRMIWLSLVAIGAAAAGVAAAQPGSGTAAHRGGPNPGANRPVGDFISNGPHSFGRRDGRGHGRRHGRHRGRDRGDDRFAYPLGYVEAVPYGAELDPHGNGFFAGRGGEIRMRNGRPVYDYDRSYPYEWAGSAYGPASAPGSGEADRSVRCTAELGVRVCRAGR